MKNRKDNPFLIWTGAAAGISLLLSMPVFDTALSFSLRELMMDRDYQRLAAVIAAAFFGLELLFLRAEKWRMLKWLPVVFPAICLISAELFWLMGGWDQIVGVILWWFGFPMLMGGGLAVMLTHLPKNRRRRGALVILLTATAILCIVFWPRALAEHIRLDVQEPMLIRYPDGTSEWRAIRSTAQVEQMLHYAEVMPVVGEPEPYEERHVLLRLNEEYILAAEYGQAPYIYDYSGELEEFNGEGVQWRFFYFTALYSELIGWGESVTEETAGSMLDVGVIDREQFRVHKEAGMQD